MSLFVLYRDFSLSSSLVKCPATWLRICIRSSLLVAREYESARLLTMLLSTIGFFPASNGTPA